MKFGDVINKLIQNNSLKYRATKEYSYQYEFDTIEHMLFVKSGILKLIKNCYMQGRIVSAYEVDEFDISRLSELEWKVVKDPVTWQEALQAWKDGKTVINELGKYGDKAEESCIRLTKSDLLAKWYID